MKNVARIGLGLAFLALTLSAYLRLARTGTGCSDWPACYGRVLPPDATAANLFPAWDMPLSVGLGLLLALCALSLLVPAFHHARHRCLGLSLLALALLAAWIDLAFAGVQHPALALGRVARDFLLLGAWGWLLFRLSPGAPKYTGTRIRKIRPVVSLALLLLCAQILFGGLTSARFAGRACTGVPDCDGAWFPDATIYSALRVDRGYQVSPAGYATGSFELKSLQLLHRWLAALATISILAATVLSYPATRALWRLGLAATGVALLVGGTGVAAALTGPGPALAPLHPALSAVLLLLLLKMHALSHERWWSDYASIGNEDSVDWDGKRFSSKSS